MSVASGRERGRAARARRARKCSLEQQVLGRVAGDAPARGTATSSAPASRARSRYSRRAAPRCRRCRRRRGRAGRARGAAGRPCARIIALALLAPDARATRPRTRAAPGRWARGPRSRCRQAARDDPAGARTRREDHGLAGLRQRGVERARPRRWRASAAPAAAAACRRRARRCRLERRQQLVVGQRVRVARSRAPARAGRWSAGPSCSGRRGRCPGARRAAPWSANTCRARSACRETGALSRPARNAISPTTPASATTIAARTPAARRNQPERGAGLRERGRAPGRPRGMSMPSAGRPLPAFASARSSPRRPSRPRRGRHAGGEGELVDRRLQVAGQLARGRASRRSRRAGRSSAGRRSS